MTAIFAALALLFAVLWLYTLVLARHQARRIRELEQTVNELLREREE